jgi:hypothetical protein
MALTDLDKGLKQTPQGAWVCKKKTLQRVLIKRKE